MLAGLWIASKRGIESMKPKKEKFSWCLCVATAILLPCLFLVSSSFGETGRVSLGEINQCGNANNEVSMVALLSDPMRFDGQCVIVEGVVVLNGFDDSRLYMSKEAAEYMIQSDSLYLSFRTGIGLDSEASKTLNGRYVRLQGVVKAKVDGSGRLLFKGIGDIGYISLSVVEQAKLEEVRKKESED